MIEDERNRSPPDSRRVEKVNEHLIDLDPIVGKGIDLRLPRPPVKSLQPILHQVL